MVLEEKSRLVGYKEIMHYFHFCTYNEHISIHIKHIFYYYLPAGEIEVVEVECSRLANKMGNVWNMKVRTGS